ncbi:hypothetical protein JCM8547_009114 [Rhodosporidiobolus lusitaniae]
MHKYEDKPLLPYLQSPPSSRSSSPPPLSPHLRAPVSSALAQFFAAKKRWASVLLLYLLVGAAWYNGATGISWPSGSRLSRFSWSHSSRGRIVHDAYGRPFSTIPSPSPLSAAVDESPTSTSLGPAADAVFHLFPPPESPSPVLLLTTLETFLLTHFPPADSDASDPSSLLNALRSFFPSPSQAPATAKIPKTVWQTAPDREYFEAKRGVTESWKRFNADWNVTQHDNEEADRWVRERFALNVTAGTAKRRSKEGGEGEEGKEKGVVAAWDRLATPAVLRSDFWRYLVLLSEGGVYADTDVQCIRPIERWAEDVSWDGKRPDSYYPPSLIVGIEADVGSRHDWHDYWPRPLQFSQWTIASARGHPVLLDAVRRIVELSMLAEEEQPKSVMERTGPGVFTDSVLSYLLSLYRKPWSSLRSLSLDGWRFRTSIEAPDLLLAPDGGQLDDRWGDVKVLSITGFSPGVGHMGAQGKSSKAACAFHGFSGSWRTQEGADA